MRKGRAMPGAVIGLVLPALVGLALVGLPRTTAAATTAPTAPPAAAATPTPTPPPPPPDPVLELAGTPDGPVAHAVELDLQDGVAEGSTVVYLRQTAGVRVSAALVIDVPGVRARVSGPDVDGNGRLRTPGDGGVTAITIGVDVPAERFTTDTGQLRILIDGAVEQLATVAVTRPRPPEVVLLGGDGEADLTATTGSPSLSLPLTVVANQAGARAVTVALAPLDEATADSAVTVTPGTDLGDLGPSESAALELAIEVPVAGVHRWAVVVSHDDIQHPPATLTVVRTQAPPPLRVLGSLSGQLEIGPGEGATQLSTTLVSTGPVRLVPPALVEMGLVDDAGEVIVPLPDVTVGVEGASSLDPDEQVTLTLDLPHIPAAGRYTGTVELGEPGGLPLVVPVSLVVRRAWWVLALLFVPGVLAGVALHLVLGRRGWGSVARLPESRRINRSTSLRRRHPPQPDDAPDTSAAHHPQAGEPCTVPPSHPPLSSATAVRQALNELAQTIRTGTWVLADAERDALDRDVGVVAAQVEEALATGDLPHAATHVRHARQVIGAVLLDRVTSSITLTRYRWLAPPTTDGLDAVQQRVAVSNDWIGRVRAAVTAATAAAWTDGDALDRYRAGAAALLDSLISITVEHDLVDDATRQQVDDLRGDDRDAAAYAAVVEALGGSVEAAEASAPLVDRDALAPPVEVADVTEPASDGAALTAGAVLTGGAEPTGVPVAEILALIGLLVAGAVLYSDTWGTTGDVVTALLWGIVIPVGAALLSSRPGPLPFSARP